MGVLIAHVRQRLAQCERSRALRGRFSLRSLFPDSFSEIPIESIFLMLSADLAVSITQYGMSSKRGKLILGV